MQEKRTNWIKAINLGIRQAKSSVEKRFKEGAPVKHRQISKRRSLFTIKSIQDKRLSTPVLKSTDSSFELNLSFQRLREEREARAEGKRTPSDILPPVPQHQQLSGSDCTLQMNPSYQAITVRKEREETRRNPRDTLPSLPSSDYEQVYDEIAPAGVHTTENEEYGYDDTIIQHRATLTDEVAPPPVPPRLRSRFSQQSLPNVVQSEDEVEYVPMNQPTGQEFVDSPAEFQDSQVSVPSIVHSNEEGVLIDDPLNAFHSANFDDDDLHLSLGNLSSLEIQSPNTTNYNAEAFLQFFTPSKSKGSELNYDPDLAPYQSNEHILAKGTPEYNSGQTVLGSGSSGSEPSCNTLQREHWRPDAKSKPLDVPPPRSDFSSSQPLSESPRSGSSPQKESFEIQTLMLQKMQQALEAVQEAYAYVPFMSQESETSKAEDGLSAVTSLHDDSILHKEKKLKRSAQLVPQAQMAKCLSKFSL